MGTYKGIQGYMVESLASDPGTLSEVIGKLWYNSGSNVWKVAKEGSGAWSSGGNLNTSKSRGAGCGITQTAAIAFGGNPGGPMAEAETYDGTTWTEVNDLNTGRINLGSAGMAPQTTAIGFGGNPPFSFAITELYDGTSWTEVGDLNTARITPAGFGVSTAAVCAAGDVPGGTINRAEVEEYNGTAWTEVTNIPIAVRDPEGTGILTSGLVFGGYTTTQTAITTEYDGTNWTEGGNLNQARTSSGGAGATQTTSLAFGGSNGGLVVATELYNGTAWTEVGDLATGRETMAGAGISTDALCISGTPLSPNLQTEEWNSPNYEAATVTTS